MRPVLLSSRVDIHQLVPKLDKLLLRQYFRKQVRAVFMGVNVDQINDLVPATLNEWTNMMIPSTNRLSFVMHLWFLSLCGRWFRIAKHCRETRSACTSDKVFRTENFQVLAHVIHLGAAVRCSHIFWLYRVYKQGHNVPRPHSSHVIRSVMAIFLPAAWFPYHES